jgi:dTDP-4-dehydrorhamnose 3,5-epimerase-like enzyme
MNQKNKYSTNACEVSGVSVHHLPLIQDNRGELTFGEFATHIPFTPKRYFVVYNVPDSVTRGQHAHKLCDQFLICLSGAVSVTVDDGRKKEDIILDKNYKGLFIPSGIWATQRQYTESASLLVFTSELYDPTDYIDSYSDFIEFRKNLI